jgi:hypothetical protein
MIWMNVFAITISLAVMARASVLLQESSFLPAPVSGALQVIGVFGITVATLGIVLLLVA